MSLGTPARDVRAAFELCAEALDRASLLLRPGITGGQVAQTMIQVLKRAGTANVGPMGHGMGLDLTEPPYLRPGDDTVVEPGMVVTIHPYLTWGSIGIWTGDTFLVTERGAERLSADRGELLVVTTDG
jgi:Xaa-Pro aminopeptidase